MPSSILSQFQNNFEFSLVGNCLCQFRTKADLDVRARLVSEARGNSFLSANPGHGGEALPHATCCFVKQSHIKATD